MSAKERGFIVITLLIVIVMIVADLFADFKEGAKLWHLLTEAITALTAMIGIFLLMRRSFELKKKLKSQRTSSERFYEEAKKWRLQSKKYIEGLSLAIQTQLTIWNLTTAEKEVALLLLKGLSLKEIAEVRKTTEKTARAQSISIYSKSGLAGRSELSAFFLEDLLLPNESIKN